MNQSENDPPESDWSGEAGEEPAKNEVTFGDCLAALPRAFLESESIFLLPAIVLLAGGLAVRAFAHLLSSVYVLLAIPLMFLVAGLFELGMADAPRSLFSYDSQSPEDGLPHERLR